MLSNGCWTCVQARLRSKTDTVHQRGVPEDILAGIRSVLHMSTEKLLTLLGLNMKYHAAYWRLV